MAANLLTGCLPGFIWGWFQVPDCRNSAGWMECVWAYALPWGTMGLTLLLFLGLRRVLPRSSWGTLVNIFAAAAVSCYYWFRIPALVGYGVYPQDGLLYDLRHTLPYWMVLTAQLSPCFFLAGGWSCAILHLALGASPTFFGQTLEVHSAGFTPYVFIAPAIWLCSVVLSGNNQ